jgi:arsenite methyltransferase
VLARGGHALQDEIAIVAATDHSERETGLNLQAVCDLEPYWEIVRKIYAPFEAGLPGPTGRVYALDMTEAMREKLRANAERCGARNVVVLEGNAEEIPLPDASVTVVTSNGVLNLVPDKPKAIGEIARVLRPGGRVQIADILLATLPSDACRSHPELWAECIVGATTEHYFLDLLRAAGLTEVEPLSRLDYFAASPSAETRKVAASFGARTLVLRATKPVS